MNLLIANSVAVFYGCVYQPIPEQTSVVRTKRHIGFKTRHLEDRLTPVSSCQIISDQS